MDPNACLQEMRELVPTIISEGGGDGDDGYRLAELVQAMDEWLCKGGFLPKAWARDR